MPFVQLLNSLDELLYELMAWLVFYPVTLWRTICRPLTMMRYAGDQLRLEEELQYRGTVSPPVTLILTIVLIQAIGIAEGNNAIVQRHTGLAGLVDDQSTLFLLRLVLFGSFALILATRHVRRTGEVLDRDNLRPAFYAQCYAIAPFALLLGIGFGLLSLPLHELAGLSVISAAFLFYAVVQVRWFMHEVGQSFIRSVVDAGIGMVASVAIMVSAGLLFA